MRGIRKDELKDLASYERVRSDLCRRIADLRERRCVRAGEKVSVVFENRETVLYQLQETLRAERIVDDAGIAREIETFNELLPKKGSLAGSLFLEPTELERIREDLDAFLGLDRGGHVWFDLGAAGRVPARFGEGTGDEGRISSVHQVRFSFEAPQIEAFGDLSRAVAFVVEHPNYIVHAGIEEPVRRELSGDLVGE